MFGSQSTESMGCALIMLNFDMSAWTVMNKMDVTWCGMPSLALPISDGALALLCLTHYTNYARSSSQDLPCGGGVRGVEDLSSKEGM